MCLNLPILSDFAGCRNVLIAGMGGGFDIFCGLPIYFALQEQGCTVHLANYSFTDPDTLDNLQRRSPTIFGVSADTTLRYAASFENALFIQQEQATGGVRVDLAGISAYAPELYLARWFRTELQQAVTVWCFAKSGVQPLRQSYQQLIDTLGIDGLILIDGGVDSLMRGDEPEPGTFIEDTVSLAAAALLEHVAVRRIVCLGLGAELDTSHWYVFRNIAAAGPAFLGSCSLVASMPAYQRYAQAVEYVHAQPFQEPSVINASVVSAVSGHYADFHLTQRTHGSRLWISPLMAIYWCFDLAGIASQHYLLNTVVDTSTFSDAVRALLSARRQLPEQPHQPIPLH